MADTTNTSSAVVRKRTDTDLMAPPPPAKRIQRPKTVLDEDAYTDGLSKIIARDFFPGLLETEAQTDYLSALESKDPAWIASASKRLREVMTPGNRRHRHRLQTTTPSLLAGDGRPAGGATPLSFVGDTPGSVLSASTTASGTTSKAAKTGPSTTTTNPDTGLSLAAFQAKYTSEDNESFYRLLDRQNQKRADKHAWLWNGNKLPSKMQLKQKEIEDRLVASGAALVDDGYSKKGGRLLAIADRDRNRRPAAPETWNTAPKNALMFGPDGLDASVPSMAEKAQAESRAPPKSIVYANTRLPDASLTTLVQSTGRRGSVSSSRASGPPSPTLSAVRAAIAGKPRRQDADSTIGSVAGSVAGTTTGGETPRVNGYAFVDDEEEQTVAAAAVDPEPIITFGKVDSTPNPFQLQAKSSREGLHHRMVERIAHNKRTAARVGMTGRAATASSTPAASSPYPYSPRVRGNLTPAGQRLWSNMAGGGQQRDAVSTFNRVRGVQQKEAKGSRRARLREMNAVLRG